MADATLTNEHLQTLVTERWLNSQRHPTLPLTIYNYTPQTAFAKHWTRETLACRGLILDDNDNVVARPFPKFFNLDERTEELPFGRFDVYEKLDGSLFIAAYYDQTHLITATRGSFVSTQAELGRLLLDAACNGMPGIYLCSDVTYCFELIHPDNRIVVNYGDRAELVLLGALMTDTGHLAPEAANRDLPLPVNRPVDFEESERILCDPTRQANREGFVYHWPEENVRVKVKFDEYKRLHRLLTGVNAVHIWEELKDGRGLAALLDRVPDEFYEWVRATEGELRKRYDDAHAWVADDFDAIVAKVGMNNRKDFAAHALKASNPPALFAILDGKDPAPIIWKGLKPERSLPFRCGEIAS